MASKPGLDSIGNFPKSTSVVLTEKEVPLFVYRCLLNHLITLEKFFRPSTVDESMGNRVGLLTIYVSSVATYII